MAKDETKKKKKADPEKFEAPTPEATEDGTADVPGAADIPAVGSIEAQLADLQATVALQAKLIGDLKQPKGLQSALQPFKLEEEPPTQRELAEKELRKYVKQGGWTRDRRTDKMVQLKPGYRKGLGADKVERANKLIKFLNENAPEGAKKRDPKKPEWDLSILNEAHKRTEV